MTVLQTLAIILAIFPLLCVLDIREMAKAKDSHVPGGPYLWTTSAYSFTPFVSLLDSGNFYTSLLYCVAMVPYFYIVQLIMFRYQTTRLAPGMILTYSGSGILVAVIIYYAVFHKGILADKQVSTVTSDTGKVVSTKRDFSTWPWLTFFILNGFVLLTIPLDRMVRKFKGYCVFFMMIAAIVNPLLALFTGRYWYDLMTVLSTQIVLLVIYAYVKKEKTQVDIFVPVYLMLHGSMLSIILYALLF